MIATILLLLVISFPFIETVQGPETNFTVARRGPFNFAFAGPQTNVLDGLVNAALGIGRSTVTCTDRVFMGGDGFVIHSKRPILDSAVNYTKQAALTGIIKPPEEYVRFYVPLEEDHLFCRTKWLQAFGSHIAVSRSCNTVVVGLSLVPECTAQANHSLRVGDTVNRPSFVFERDIGSDDDYVFLFAFPDPRKHGLLSPPSFGSQTEQFAVDWSGTRLIFAFGPTLFTRQAVGLAHQWQQMDGAIEPIDTGPEHRNTSLFGAVTMAGSGRRFALAIASPHWPSMVWVWARAADDERGPFFCAQPFFPSADPLDKSVWDEGVSVDLSFDGHTLVLGNPTNQYVRLVDLANNRSRVWSLPFKPPPYPVYRYSFARTVRISPFANTLVVGAMTCCTIFDPPGALFVYYSSNATQNLRDVDEPDWQLIYMDATGPVAGRLTREVGYAFSLFSHLPTELALLPSFVTQIFVPTHPEPTGGTQIPVFFGFFSPRPLITSSTPLPAAANCSRPFSPSTSSTPSPVSVSATTTTTADAVPTDDPGTSGAVSVISSSAVPGSQQQQQQQPVTFSNHVLTAVVVTACVFCFIFVVLCCVALVVRNCRRRRRRRLSLDAHGHEAAAHRRTRRGRYFRARTSTAGTVKRSRSGTRLDRMNIDSVANDFKVFSDSPPAVAANSSSSSNPSSSNTNIADNDDYDGSGNIAADAARVSTTHQYATRPLVRSSRRSSRAGTFTDLARTRSSDGGSTSTSSLHYVGRSSRAGTFTDLAQTRSSDGGSTSTSSLQYFAPPPPDTQSSRPPPSEPLVIIPKEELAALNAQVYAHSGSGQYGTLAVTWFCACGNLNLSTVTTCPKCQQDKVSAV